MLLLRFLLRRTAAPVPVPPPASASPVTTSPAIVRTERGEPALNVVPEKSQWWKLLALVAFALVAALALMQFVWLIARPLALLFGAIVIAQAMAPAVDRLERFMPRVLATLLCYAVLILVLVGLGWLVFPPLVSQAQDVVDRAPELVDDGRQLLNRWDPSEDGQLEEMITTSVQGFAGYISDLPMAIVSSVVEVFLVFVMSIYWVIAAPNMRRFTLSLFPPHRREGAADVLGQMGTAIGGYVRGTAIDAVIVAGLVYGGLTIIGVEYALVLAILAGLGEFVPIIGPFVAGAPAVLIALLDSPVQALIVLVFYVVLQQVEANFLLPIIMNNQAHVPPLLVLFAIFVGGTLAGILGALIAIPFAGAARVFVIRVLAPAIRQWTGAPDPGDDPGTKDTG
jgi:predicted PurR-regulated permease PerM